MVKPNYYSMTKERRGCCVIINNVKFYASPERFGSNEDKLKLKKTFGDLKFEISVYQNLKADEIRRKVKKFSDKDHSNYDCFVCCVLSHGREDHVLGTDEEAVRIEEIRGRFNGKNCPSLLNKPTFFIIQAGQGREYTQRFPTKTDDDKNSEDAPHHGNPKSNIVTSASFHPSNTLDPVNESVSSCTDDTDWIVWLSATPGKLSWKNEETGSWFIGDVCDVLDKSSSVKPISDLFVEINHKVSQREQKQGINEARAMNQGYQMRESMRGSWYIGGGLKKGECPTQSNTAKCLIDK